MAITINGTGSITGLTAGGLPDGSVTSADIASGVIPDVVSVARVYDAKSSGTEGGTFTSGADRTRDLNSEDDPDNIVTISSNQFTLGAGTYFIQWNAPAYDCANHRSLLYDVTGATNLAMGQAQTCIEANNVANSSVGSHIHTITASNTYEIRHRCTTTKTTYGLGVSSSYGTTEIYTIVNIYKLS